MIKKYRRGFTLTELIFVSSIELIAIMIAIQLFVSWNKDYKVLASYLNCYLRGREAIDRISKDSRIAIRVMDSYSGYTTTDSSLVLRIPSIDSSGNIIDVNNEFDYIVYRIQGQDLWKKIIPGPLSSRSSYDGILKKSIESLYMESNGTPLSGISHKSSITRITMWVSIVETFMGKDYRINPGTTVKLMNYEWEFVR